MSYIREIGEIEAAGELAATYARIREERGRVANILKVHSLRPAALEHHLELYMGLLYGPGKLTRAQREMIAVVVSRANRCEYCVNHHREALARYVRDSTMLDLIESDFAAADVPPPTRALLVYAERLTREPESIRGEDIKTLRAAGFGDEEILHANLIAAYFNFVNRIALGLGVDYNADEVSGYNV
ncbi:MAG: peroxidase-related enzyme [Xanthomonadaceae bacterium]|nr:peroxidase-related enzyme [Xanthomonadaceae bacterium]